MRFQRRLQPMVNVDLVPMIDVVFQLVVFFMLSSTLITRTGLNLDLPRAGSAQEAVTSTLVLSVVSESEIYLGSDRYTLAGLNDLLEANREEYSDRSIAIEADTGFALWHDDFRSRRSAPQRFPWGQPGRAAASRRGFMREISLRNDTDRAVVALVIALALHVVVFVVVPLLPEGSPPPLEAPMYVALDPFPPTEEILADRDAPPERPPEAGSA
jgi:biopolymer transport protein ExbD